MVRLLLCYVAMSFIFLVEVGSGSSLDPGACVAELSVAYSLFFSLSQRILLFACRSIATSEEVSTWSKQKVLVACLTGPG